MESRHIHVNSDSFFGGVGLRPTHYPHLLSQGAGRVQWFEVISENYMDSFGRPREILKKIRQDHPIALHGVSMSLGSPEGLNLTHLQRLKQLIHEVDPFIVSDHLCWSKWGAHYSHDLLPVEYTRESLQGLIGNIQQAQEFLGRQILIENVSAYVQSTRAEFTEWDFLVQVARKSGCKILLDVNNVYVNAVNFGFDPMEYLRSIPPELVGQIHLAGFTDMGDYLFDTHSKAVHDNVWKLFTKTSSRLQQVPVLIEWDDDIPDFHFLEQELHKAEIIWNRTHNLQGVYEESNLL
ncbi:DUF692 domain-containing protein [Bdellovibrio sp. HCB337]|uniref:MNIO family bufferin maturase n=1 Tax=Bdellovibrio sp. HCB337 TaxID=3394358 RepID=UPI0039A6C4D0